MGLRPNSDNLFAYSMNGIFVHGTKCRQIPSLALGRPPSYSKLSNLCCKTCVVGKLFGRYSRYEWLSWRSRLDDRSLFLICRQHHVLVDPIAGPRATTIIFELFNSAAYICFALLHTRTASTRRPTAGSDSGTHFQLMLFSEA